MTLYRHHKGGLYYKLAEAKMEATGEEMVVYEPFNGHQKWIRPKAEFDEKFTNEDNL